MAWQRFALRGAVRSVGCAITLNCDAATIANVRPAVTMSRDMLSYEPGEIDRYGLGKAWLRLRLLEYLQNRSLRSADGAIFLTRYAAQMIQRSSGPIQRLAIIPHGVGEEFRGIGRPDTFPAAGERSVRCIYVSNAALHKHQGHVVHAISLLRERGYDVELILAGGGGSGEAVLEEALRTYDPDGAYVRWLPFLSHPQLVAQLSEADLFVFASSCENMPNTLIEGMASGLPIASSDRGPMPEVLRDGGLYFDPESPRAIASSIERLITDPELRSTLADRATRYAAEFSWSRCADETLAFVRECLNREHVALEKNEP